MSMSLDQFQAEEQAVPQPQVVPSLGGSSPARKRSPEHIFADGDPEPLTKKWKGFDNSFTFGSPTFGSPTFEFNSPLSSPEFAVSPPDTILLEHPSLASLCHINDTLAMSSDPASAAVISAAWEETMARLIITEQPEGVGTSYCVIFVAIVILLQCLTKILMSSRRGICNLHNFAFPPILQYYRARYECEGRRGPVKGLRETHPSVQVCSDIPPLIIKDQLHVLTYIFCCRH